MAEKLPDEVKPFEGEEILLTYGRKYASFSIPVGISAIVVMTFLLIFYFGLMMRYSEFINFIGILLILIFSTIFILALSLGKMYTDSYHYYITNDRIIIFKKFVSISIREVLFERVTDFIVEQGPVGRWKNYGTIAPITAGVEYIGLAMAFFSLLGVEDPYNARTKMLELRQNALGGD